MNWIYIVNLFIYKDLNTRRATNDITQMPNLVFSGFCEIQRKKIWFMGKNSHIYFKYMTAWFNFIYIQGPSTHPAGEK